jgi:hypothetical protein
MAVIQVRFAFSGWTWLEDAWPTMPAIDRRRSAASAPPAEVGLIANLAGAVQGWTRISARYRPDIIRH